MVPATKPKKPSGKNSSKKSSDSIDLRHAPWADLERMIAKSAKKQRLHRMIPHGAESLRWGLAVAGASDDDRQFVDSLGRLFEGGEADFNYQAAAEALADSLAVASARPATAGVLLAWAYALPSLTDVLGDTLWWRTLEELQTMCQLGLEQAPAHSWQRLVLACELAAVLAIRLPDLPSCSALGDASAKAFAEWGREHDDCLTAALQGGGAAVRIILASLVRQLSLEDAVKDRPVRKRHRAIGQSLMEAAAATIRPDGSCAGGLLVDAGVDDRLWSTVATYCDAKGALGAIRSLAEKSKKRKRLSDEADFPDPYFHDADAMLVAWQPSWSSQHGRWWVDYAREPLRIELGTGRSIVLHGDWSSLITLDGTPIKPAGRWEENCWFTDNEVHYFELQREFEGGVRVQRQMLHLIDDDLLLLAEGIITPGQGSLECATRLSTGQGVQIREEPETRELFLNDGQRDRAVILPLGLNEWRTARTNGTFEATSERDAVVLKMRGIGRLDCAMVIDLNPARLAAVRTWRQLTVAENMKIVPRDVAVGYRVQCAVTQWMFYRTLAPAANRTVMGKNLSNEFFAGRFDAAEGTYEELVFIESET